MANGNYSVLKDNIDDYIKQNGDGDITGQVLQTQLFAMINSLGAGYQFMGVAKLTPTPTDPGSPDQNVFYVAFQPGIYSNFGSQTVADGEIAILKWNGSWTKEVTGAASAAKLDELGHEVDFLADLSRDNNNLGFPYVGMLNSSGVYDSTQTNWRTSDFIEMTDYGHIVIGNKYNPHDFDICFYSAADESTFIGSIVSGIFATTNAHFVNFKNYVSLKDAPAGAKYFRVYSYKNDTYADGHPAGIYAMNDKSVLDYIFTQDGTGIMNIVDADGNMVAKIREDGQLVSNMVDMGLYMTPGELTDYAAIARNTIALADWMLRAAGTGKTLYIPEGVWCIASGLAIIQSGVAIRGASRASILKVKKSVTDSLMAVFGYSNTSESAPIENASFCDLTIDMSEYTLESYEMWNVNQKAIFCQWMNDCKIHNVKIIGSPATAIGVDYVQNSSITDCVLENCGKYWANKTAIHEGIGGCAGIGIGTGGHDDENLAISGNICDGCGQFGIFIENQGEAFNHPETSKPSRGIVISNNVVRKTRRHGIGVRGADTCVVDGNDIYENYGTGLFFELTCKDVLITGNNIARNGVFTEDPDDLDFNVDSNRFGVYFWPLATFTNVKISGNSIKDNYAGVVEEGTLTKVDVSDNIIGNDSDDYLMQGTSTSAYIARNIIAGDFKVKGTHASLCFKYNIIYGSTINDGATLSGDNRFNDLVS